VRQDQQGQQVLKVLRVQTQELKVP